MECVNYHRVGGYQRYRPDGSLYWERKVMIKGFREPFFQAADFGEYLVPQWD